MAARLAPIRSTYRRNIYSTFSRSEAPSAKEEDVIDIPVADEEVEFVMETEDIRTTHVGVRRLIESTSHVFQEATLDHRNEELLEVQVNTLHETDSLEAARSQETTFYQAVEKVVCRVIAPDAVNEVSHTKAVDLA